MFLTIVPLAPEHLESAMSMVAARYCAARKQIPFLPARFEDPRAILPRLEDQVGHVPGVAALREDQLVGFISTLLVTNRGERLACVPDFGHAADRGDSYEIYRRMYATIADQWLANGCFWHAITVYPHEREALDAWVSVGFGLAVVDALQSLDALPPLAITLDIRRAQVGDIAQIVPLELALERHLASSPTYLPLIVEGGRRSLRDWLADESHALWLAFQAGKAVAYLRLEPSEGLVLPTASETTVAITGAYTREDVRGTGIGTALLRHGLEWARAAGYRHCSVDFESANLLGSRFWLRHFEPVCHSLMRRVNPNLAWAHARRDEVDVERAYSGRTWVG